MRSDAKKRGACASAPDPVALSSLFGFDDRDANALEIIARSALGEQVAVGEDPHLAWVVCRCGAVVRFGAAATPRAIADALMSHAAACEKGGAS